MIRSPETDDITGPRGRVTVEVFSGPKITSYPNPTCINNNKKKINPTRDRPEEIRPESDPTAFIFEPDWTRT